MLKPKFSIRKKQNEKRKANSLIWVKVYIWNIIVRSKCTAFMCFIAQIIAIYCKFDATNNFAQFNTHQIKRSSKCEYFCPKRVYVWRCLHIWHAVSSGAALHCTALLGWLCMWKLLNGICLHTITSVPAKQWLTSKHQTRSKYYGFIWNWNLIRKVCWQLTK